MELNTNIRNPDTIEKIIHQQILGGGNKGGLLIASSLILEGIWIQSR